MTARSDDRLGDAPMEPVSCGSCGAQVLVRKSSWQQTSVQWNAVARQRCIRSDRPVVGGGAVEPDVFLALCPPLRESIEAAVQQGTLPVLEDGPVLDDGPVPDGEVVTTRGRQDAEHAYRR